MNKKKISIIISLIIGTILLISVISAIIVKEKNKKLLENNPVINIYQYPVTKYNIDFKNEPTLLYSFNFDKDLKQELKIDSIDKSVYNLVKIEDGIVWVEEANCKNHICERSKIKLNSSIFSTTQIVCMPSGLVIKVENK